MKYNLTWIMQRAWSLHREKGFTLATSLRLAWREAKGEKVTPSTSKTPGQASAATS